METVVLNGTIGIEEFSKYNDLVSQPDVKHIDISDFSIDIGVDNVIEHYFYDDEPKTLLEKLFINKEFASVFVIENGLVLSQDRQILIGALDDNLNTIPDGIRIIGHFAFCNGRFKSIKLPDGLTRIGIAAFFECDYLTEITLPNSVEYLGESAFHGCDLGKVTFSKNLKAIPAGCFDSNFIKEINIPSSVKEIEDWAFAFNYNEKVILPEGVESIGGNAFEIDEIYFPSTMRVIAKDFYYEENIDEPQQCLPYIEVSMDNPLFFSKGGTLYSYENPEVPYLGYTYRSENYENEEKGKEDLVIFPNEGQGSQTEYTPEEIYARFPSYNCKPINDEESLFWIYELNNGHNIIDRHLNKYLNPRRVYYVQFSRNNFILIKDNSFDSFIYSIDLKNILMDESDGYKLVSCDDEGRIYVGKDVPLPKTNNYLRDLLSSHNEHYRYGCINLQKEVIIPCEYKDLYHFDECGFAIARKGSKEGAIDLNNNILIPFEYSSFYSNFHGEGIAIVSKKSKGISQYMFINRKNEVVGTFVEQGFVINEKRFHIYTHNGLYGYTRQFGHYYNGTPYKDIKVIDEETIEVSLDGINYQEVKY